MRSAFVAQAAERRDDPAFHRTVEDIRSGTVGDDDYYGQALISLVSCNEEKENK